MIRKSAADAEVESGAESESESESDSSSTKGEGASDSDSSDVEANASADHDEERVDPDTFDTDKGPQTNAKASSMLERIMSEHDGTGDTSHAQVRRALHRAGAVVGSYLQLGAGAVAGQGTGAQAQTRMPSIVMIVIPVILIALAGTMIAYYFYLMDKNMRHYENHRR